MSKRARWRRSRSGLRPASRSASRPSPSLGQGSDHDPACSGDLMRTLTLGAAMSVALSLAPRSDPLDEFVGEQMRARRVPGLSLAVVQNGQIAKAAAYGFRDREARLPVTANTLFQAGSVSKSVAALG